MKIIRIISFVVGFILLLLIPTLYHLYPNFFSYFVTYKEYFKTIVPAVFTCAAIMSTWLLSKYQNERDIRKKQQETLENNRPKFLFKNYLNTDLIATAKNGNSYVKDFYLVGINTNGTFFNLQMKPYIFIKDIYVSNILFKDFIIYYKTSENECFICLYQDKKFTYFNITISLTTENQLLVNFLERINRFPILDNYDYNNNDVFLESIKTVVDDVKANKINKACKSLLWFIRIYIHELPINFIAEKLEVITFILKSNKYECRSYSNIKFLKSELIHKIKNEFNQVQMEKLENTNEVDLEFILQYIESIIEEINNQNFEELDEFILRIIEIYIENSINIFTIDYETKRNLVNFESIEI